MSDSKLGASSEDAGIFEIFNYSKTFEVSQSKKYQTLSWFPSPNKFDSGGMLETLAEDNGLSYIGVWYLVLQMASTMPKRGVFVSDSGKPLTLKRIAVTIRVDYQSVKESFAHFMSIGWIVKSSGIGVSSEHTDSKLGARVDKIRIDKKRIDKECVETLEAVEPVAGVDIYGDPEKPTRTQRTNDFYQNSVMPVIFFPESADQVINHAMVNCTRWAPNPKKCTEFFDMWSACGWTDSNNNKINWKQKLTFFLRDYKEEAKKSNASDMDDICADIVSDLGGMPHAVN